MKRYLLIQNLLILFTLCIFSATSAASKQAPKSRKTRTNPSRTKARATISPTLKAQQSFGLALTTTELVAFEHFYRQGFWALKTSLSLPLPIDITVNMPEDNISTSNGLRFDHPDYTIDAELTWGPSLGLEAYFFPNSGIFYLSLGATYHSLSLDAKTESSLLIKDLNNPETVFETGTIFMAEFESETKNLLFKSKVGALLQFSRYHMDIGLGLSSPKNISRIVSGSVDIDAPGNSDSSLPEDDLSTIRAEKSGEIEDQVIKELKTFDEKILPLATISVGVYF